MIRTPLQQFQNTWPAGKGAFDVSGEFVYSGVANILGVSSVSELGQPPHTLSLEGGGGDTQLLLDPSDSQSQTEHVWIGPPPQTPAHSFLLRSQQTALPPHMSWHASEPALDFFLRDTTEDLILPLNKAGPAISALESISS